jgi:membrane protease YdiL (CAAX protease family)
MTDALALDPPMSPASPTRERFSIGQAIVVMLGILGIFAVLIIGAIVAAAIIMMGNPHFFQSTMQILGFAMVIQLMTYAPVCLWTLFMLARYAPLEAYGLTRPKKSDISTLAVGVAAIVVVTDLLEAAMKLMTKKPLQPDLLGHNPSLGLMIAVVIMSVILAPFTEELVFRGVIFRALRTKLPLWLTLALSSAIFAGCHFEPLAFLPLMGAGIVLGLIYERTKNLFLSMGAHATLNAIGVFDMIVAIVRHHP